jgi:cation diffusion facilitator family transporter
MNKVSAKQNFNFQKIIALVGIVLLILKVVAYYYTNSVAVLTDALESIINVVTGIIGLYSLYLASLPKDQNHPYGHGKVEFVSAAIEGTLISVAGLVIIYEVINNIWFSHTVQKLDIGIILISITAFVNYLLGFIAINLGKKNISPTLIASGKHLQTDTYSTLGIILGLILLSVFKYSWIDSAVALIFAFIIIYTGYKIVRTSLAGIMDEADTDLLNELVKHLSKNRRENWIDLHNLRIIKYGGTLHVDCHLTVPWYLYVNEAHDEVEILDKLVKENFGETLELFVHTDACMEFSCKLCSKPQCAVRKHQFVKQIAWSIDNISFNKKHRIE